MIDSSLKQIKIMCVDDNPLVTEALKVQFRDVPGIECISIAASADEMLQKAETGCPDVVVLDYDMPGKPSLEAIGELQDVCHDARVIMFSGYIGKEIVDRAINAGAWGYVAKVDSHGELVEAIRKVAEGSFAFSPAVQRITHD